MSKALIINTMRGKMHRLMSAGQGLTLPIDQHSPTAQVKYWDQALLCLLPKEALISLPCLDSRAEGND